MGGRRVDGTLRCDIRRGTWLPVSCDCRRASLDCDTLTCSPECTPKTQPPNWLRHTYGLLTFGVDGVERQRGLAGAGQARDDDELVPGQIEVDVFQIVGAGPSDLNGVHAVIG